jgi:hypothetical protein
MTTFALVSSLVIFPPCRTLHCRLQEYHDNYNFFLSSQSRREREDCQCPLGIPPPTYPPPPPTGGLTAKGESMDKIEKKFLCMNPQFAAGDRVQPLKLSWSNCSIKLKLFGKKISILSCS